MNRKLRHITLMALLLLTGSVVMAQNDGAYVINLGNHYLAHVKVNDTWVLQDATEFNPDNCLWYSGRDFNVSGTNHNYYFFDETGTPRYLAAPLQANGTIYLSGTTPPATYLLSNPDMDYYFYDWDRDEHYGYGVARGHQYAGITSQTECTSCGSNYVWDNGAGECWEVYWVGYSSDGWKMSSTSSYGIITGFAARYHSVTVTQHPVQVSNPSGGLSGLSGVPASMTYPSSASISGTTTSYTHTYIPAYGEYAFEGGTHYFYNNHEQSSAPSSRTVTQSMDSCRWTITGPGAEFLTLSNAFSTSTTSTTLSYSTENTTGHKTATVTLTVYYPSGATQTSSETVQVLMQCSNPAQAAAPVVSDLGVTVSWVASADQYRVEWKKHTESTYGTPVEVGTATSYTITGLEYDIDYDYRVTGKCGSNWLTAPTAPTGTFKTKKEPNLMVYGAIFGGGRMADVRGKTEVVIVNCDSIGAIYGGNDIAGEVKGNNGVDGSTITLGVNAGGTYASYGTTPNNGKVRVGSVYGGGNGYYIYDGNSPSPAVGTTVLSGGTFSTSVTELSGGDSYLTTGTIPKITKTAITLTNDAVRVDSIFGGAKNAFLSASSGNSTSITVNGGTAIAVFGGNNFGGVSGTGTSKHAIEVTGTKAETTVANYNAKETGRDFGVRYLFGGGNKVAALESDILISGGQCDTVFAGGNSADVTAAKVVVNCSVASGSGVTFGNTYSNAIASATSSSVTVKDNDNYAWNGTGIYNVRTLFGGNNRANMTGLPTVTLTSGSVGTVYGGGNAGNMLAKIPDGGSSGIGGPIAFDFGPQMEFNGSVYEPLPIWYGTHVVMNQATMLVDYLYGGCQMSDVEYSAWVEIQNGHVGTVYGGCNISGDVGSGYRISYSNNMPKDQYQETKGAIYVKASGGTIHGNLFAGSNGFYHCNNGVEYVSGLNFGTPPYDPEERYVGMVIPTHNETHVMVSGTATVDGNVYAGGNMAYVGFIPSTDQSYRFRDFVGLSSVRMNGGEVKGDVYGGGNRASVFGSNEVKVSGGKIGGALYGGNDRAGQVAQISNRVFYGEYATASDGITNLKTLGVNTFVSVTGRPDINTVYGGGNGAYTYTSDEYCDITDQPVQANTFVDINLDGYPDGPLQGGHIETVYGGGNGVTVTGGITVLLNVKGEDDSTPPLAYDHVNNLFGGNNQGPLAILPDIILMSGQANTVYGGCNAGAMTGSHTLVGADSENYTNVGSRVHLRPTYTPVGTTTTVDLLGTVSHAVYGGCRMNGVNNNSIVLVEGGTYAASLFGGSDISGDVDGTSRVIVKNGTVGNVYGGGNGDYDYTSGDYAGMTAPTCATSQVDILGGQVGASGTNALGESNARNVFGGGLGHDTKTMGNVTVNIGTANAASAAVSPVIYGDVYGGSALGYVNTNDKNTTSLSDITTSTTVNVLNGILHGDVYGGGLGDAETNANGYLSGNGDVTEAYVYGTVQVNIGHPDSDNSTHSNYSKYLTLDGSVFGGNNLAGSPKANVYVDVYRTAHDANNIYPSSFPNPLENSFFEVDTRYALNEVYGGGNLAEYQPLTGGSTNVHVHNCDENTIKYVYGGGNAADVPTSYVTIDGGLVKYVFGGGNGDGTGNPGANVNGNDTLALNGGRMGYVFGGSNKVGMVHGETSLLFADPATCSPRSINELYGGGNQAECEAITLNVPCGTEGVKTIYGGSKNADVTGNSTTSTPGNVTLNVHGGALESVYGGNNIGGIIHGDVTVNLYGGTIDTVFGGNNHGGNILGLIKVNVLDEGNITCPLILTHVFGGGNKADYEPNPANVTSPVVNVMHITEKTGAPGIKGNVFGGGNLAGVTANPQVNIGYVNSLSSYVPSGYTAPASYRAYVAGNVYGGGNEAGVTGNPVVNMNNGTVVSGIFGGCNNSGTITGNIEVNVFDGTLGTNSVAMTEGIFGGGYGENTQTSGNISVNIGDATHEPEIFADIYGGSALGDVHATTADVTTVNFAKGTLNGNLYGGGLGQVTPSPISAEVNGNVVVNIGKDKAGTTIDGGHIYGSVFGANNINGSPKGTVTVNVYSAVTDSIFGGGNASPYTPTDATIAYPKVNVSGGEIKYKVVGGGNAAGITANPTVNISGGDVCTDNSTSKAGVYGGCNTSGTVTGDITLNITGTTTSQTTIGTLAALNAEKPVNVHGGGYGSGTATTGTVTVNFGVDDGVSGHCEYPMLYGDLYGGSALGNVNSDVNDSTNVNILNGSVKCVKKTVGLSTVQYGGNIYGGGLGQDNPPIEAKVYGKVHVNIGAPPVAPSTNPTGMASLVNCNVYGCNNKNGSPQQDTYVDVYQTTHTETDNVNYTDEHSRTYAIQYVFGGGNQADYHPDANTGWAKRTHNHIHGCDNTVEIVYGGGNAADCDGVYLTVDGGRFDFVFGGGNGQLQEANVGEGSAIIYLKGGLIGWYFSGCNLHGSIAGTIDEHQGCEGDDCCQVFKIEKYYFGANEATIYEGIENHIDCSDASFYNFTYVYAGSRLAVVYGDIKLTVRGGTIGNLFGGSEGSVDISADVRKYPADWDDIAKFPAEHQAGLQDYFRNGAHDDQYGKGGNIILNVEGGTIGTVFGGCDFRGRVEGDITVTIDSTQTGTCALDINYVYGGNNLAAYAPDSTLVGGVMTATPDPNRVSPKVIFKNGHVNGTIYGGSKGGDSGHSFGNGLIVGNPKVVIGDTDASNKVKLGGTLTGVTPTTQGDGNVYGGGNAGKIIGDTDVILQGKATIGGNVFGGGKQADVEGNTNVTIVPNNP